MRKILSGGGGERKRMNPSAGSVSVFHGGLRLSPGWPVEGIESGEREFAWKGKGKLYISGIYSWRVFWGEGVCICIQ